MRKFLLSAGVLLVTSACGTFLETGLPPGSLGGLSFGAADKVYFVDMLGHRVLRIDPL